LKQESVVALTFQLFDNLNILQKIFLLQYPSQIEELSMHKPCIIKFS